MEENAADSLAEPLISSPETSPRSNEAPPSESQPDEESSDPLPSDSLERQGTISSACFNMWSTMVGGGCLSLPLAFAKSGNVLGGPILLWTTAVITRTCFRYLIDGSRWSNQKSYEGIATVAFGKRAYHFCTVLVTLMCFFGIVGYAVLLRDMLQPITDHLFQHNSETWPHRNALMFLIVFLVTPLCTLKTLTALEKFGAMSMGSIVALGLCVLFRSSQCLLHPRESSAPGGSGFQLLPRSWKDVLDVVPLFISCYVCHYNIPAVQAELKDPSPRRVSQWLTITVMGSTAFYTILGLSGSVYALRCHGGAVDGNILLDFPEDDPLVLVGRLCLAVTITLAFPMLTIPARDIVIRSLQRGDQAMAVADTSDENEDDDVGLDEPFLERESNAIGVTATPATPDEENVVASAAEASSQHPSLGMRLSASLAIFWTGATLASCVSSIDVVWDLLGSSLSILLSFLIPFASYIQLSRNQTDASLFDTVFSGLMLVVFTPLMFVSTANAIYHTFLQHTS